MIHVTLAVTGSISAYKAADITSQLGKLGYSVSVLMTEAASHFITPLTLQVLSKNPVSLDLMDEPRPDKVNHMERLKKFGWEIIEPREAVLACGDHGTGALADVNIIIEKVKEIINEKTI